jgi:hypothetical protein
MTDMAEVVAAVQAQERQHHRTAMVVMEIVVL